jgi:phosphoribosylaminoimidazolecarboxamide formyltransferase/IMP cyclohydrolase
MRREGGARDMQAKHRIVGGMLVQQRDLVGVVESEWKTVTRRHATAAELAALKFNWLVCKHVKSNAVVVGGEHGTYGIGGGQVDRVAAAEQAVKKAGERAMGAVAASDAFFPFPDGPQVLIQAGVTAIIQPGGSVRDQAIIDLCDAAGVAMIFTGRRHFRH